jgi:protein tyrosine phosphatase (PTP) superfamily phosphohydrolase (DUF442 family)
MVGLLLNMPVRTATPPPEQDPGPGVELAIRGIQHSFRVTERVYSGSQPEGEAAFAELARLGIATLVSVDGAKPDLEAARKQGLRYVHLPLGYDGIPPRRLAELAQVLNTLPGPFYVHCHHGKHRGPAAAAVLCLLDGWPRERAADWLRQAGTADDYPGLHRAISHFEHPSSQELAAITYLPEIAETSSLVDAMVAIEEHFGRLRAVQRAGWKTPPGHADLSPSHEARMLWEQIRDLAHMDDTAARPADYRVLLQESELAADVLRELLRGTAAHPPAENKDLNAALRRVTQSCSACHKKYRN